MCLAKHPKIYIFVSRLVEMIFSYKANQLFVESWAEYLSMSSFVSCNTYFWNYKSARYYPDAIFLLCYRISGTVQEESFYYCGKIKGNVYKLSVSFLQNFIASVCIKHYPGSKSNIYIMHDIEQFHHMHLSKTGTVFPDIWPYSHIFPCVGHSC